MGSDPKWDHGVHGGRAEVGWGRVADLHKPQSGGVALVVNLGYPDLGKLYWDMGTYSPSILLGVTATPECGEMHPKCRQFTGWSDRWRAK